MKDTTGKVIQAGTEVTSSGALAVAGGLLAAGHPFLAVAAAMAQPALNRLVTALTSKTMPDDLREQIKKTFVDELSRHFEAVDHRLTEMERAGQRLDWDKVNPEEVWILIGQYYDHAQRSSREERRKMLAAAAAGSTRPDIDAEMKSRAERAMAILEPSDVAVLRDFLSKVSSDEEVARHFGSWSGIRAYWDEQPMMNRASLEQVGCIFIKTEFHRGFGTEGRGHSGPAMMNTFVQPTPLGWALVRLLETYQGRDEDRPKRHPSHQEDDE